MPDGPLCSTTPRKSGVTAACAAAGILRTTYYRWVVRAERYGLAALRSAGFVPRHVPPPPQLVGAGFGLELVNGPLRRLPVLPARTDPQDQAQLRRQPQRPLTPVRFASHTHPRVPRRAPSWLGDRPRTRRSGQPRI